MVDLANIEDGLNDRFALLTGGPRTAPARQQTLRAAVAWSYELLSPGERDLFCRLSVFPGSFSMDAAVAVAGPSTGDPATDLFALVSKSMVATVASGSRRPATGCSRPCVSSGRRSWASPLAMTSGADTPTSTWCSFTPLAPSPSARQ